jgi:hypothetical protein
MHGTAASGRGGWDALESSLYDLVGADDEACSSVEALARPDNVRSVSEESAVSAAQHTAPKPAVYEEQGGAHSCIFSASASSRPGTSARTAVASGDNDQPTETASSTQHGQYLLESRLEVARERNRWNQRACRERVRVRCRPCAAYVSPCRLQRHM